MRLHSSPTCFKWNISATDRKEGPIGFPLRKRLPRSPANSSVSVNSKCLTEAVRGCSSHVTGVGQNTAPKWSCIRLSFTQIQLFSLSPFDQANPTFNYLIVWGLYRVPLWVSSELIARWWRSTWNWTHYERPTQNWITGTLPTPGRCNMTQLKSLIVPYKLPFIAADLVDCLASEAELRLRDGPFM